MLPSASRSRRLRPLAAIGLALLPSLLLAQASRLEGIVLPFREVVVSSPVQSTIESLAVREGDSVNQGQVLAQLYAKPEEIDLSRARAVVQKREFDYRSAKRLFDDQIVSEDKELEARIELELAQRQEETAAENVRLRTITAPLSGTVVERLREAGEAVTATQPLFRIIDITQVYVQFFIRSEDVGRFQPGQSLAATFPDLTGEQTFIGTIDFIDPRVDASSGLMRVRVLIDNPQQTIKAGMRATLAAR